MRIIEATNVNIALRRMLVMLSSQSIERQSRDGVCLEIPTPVTTIYKNPWERVLLSPERDANPFFHLMEALWMLAGRNDLPYLIHYNRWMEKIMEPNGTQHGAYGHRWRVHFGKDQLNGVVELLQNKPKSRRAVIQMYDPFVDLDPTEKCKDVPCNLTITLQLFDQDNIMGPDLDMTVFCRSNDALWGAAGANAVHFSILHEYLARRLGVNMGKLYQISVNLHTYSKTYDPLIAKGIMNRPVIDPYRATGKRNVIFEPTSIISDAASFEDELEAFMEPDPLVLSDKMKWRNLFFPEVAIPMERAYGHFRNGVAPQKYDDMQKILAEGRSWSDWIIAAQQWTDRRLGDFIDHQATCEDEEEV